VSFVRRHPRLVFAALALGVLLLAALVGLRIAAGQLEAVLRETLGPRASVGAVSLDLTGVTVEDLRIRAASGWPAEDELRARRVHLRPGLATLWSRGWHVRSIEVEQAYLSLQRTRNGRLRVLPALTEKGAAAADTPGSAASASRPTLRIAQIELADTTIDFFDASVRQGTHRVRLDQLRAELGPLLWPSLDEAMQVELSARLKGLQRDGQLEIAGTLTPATRDAKLKANARGIDLVALQPYLLKVNEAGVRRGTLDLKLDATVRAQHLHAPGRLTLTGLELAAGGGVLSTFAGVPRQTVIAAMQRDGRIDVGFTLDGRLDDPGFSLNENFATRLGGGLAEALGVSLGGVVEGVGGVIKGLFGR